MTILNPKLKEKVHIFWLTATAEVCQTQARQFFQNLTKQSSPDQELHKTTLALIVDATVTIQYAILTNKIKANQSITAIQTYCLKVLWHDQPIDYHEYLHHVIHVAWLLLQECFEEIAQLAQAKLSAYLESEEFNSKYYLPPPDGYLEDGTPVWSLASFAKQMGQSVKDVKEQLLMLLDDDEDNSPITMVSTEKVFTRH
jgi:hypothetical protein